MRTELARLPAGAVGVKRGSSQLEAMGSERWLWTPLPRSAGRGSDMAELLAVSSCELTSHSGSPVAVVPGRPSLEPSGPRKQAAAGAGLPPNLERIQGPAVTP